MSTTELYILPDDRLWLNARIDELDKAIQDLGPDFHNVFNQSSETWHDNAPFDALRDKQSVLFAEFSNLKLIRKNAALALPRAKKDTVHYDTQLTIKGRRYHLRGDWTPHAGTVVNEAIVISAQSPLGSAILGKKAGDTTKFGIIETLHT